jgi:hypothetical protein
MILNNLKSSIVFASLFFTYDAVLNRRQKKAS